jgi:tetratricopeptide (TPR) repeat protein
MRRFRNAILLSFASAALTVALSVTLGVHAQEALSGEAGLALDEERAFAEAQQGHHIKAREIAERVVRERPTSFAGHFVLGFVHHYGEANFARALYHQNRALALLVEQHGAEPGPDGPWRWHARILREMVWTHGDLENYEEQLRYMARYSELYEPDFVAEHAWPLMKLRRFDDARRAARAGQDTGEPRQVEVALNALCAIEFEAGDNEASYRACHDAMMLHGGDPSRQGAVDFTNFAEAARSVFRLDEAERVGQLATEAQVSWYGNPWIELGELYVREARYLEALSALRRVPEYRAQRPPHVRDADRNEGRRTLATFFLVIGRGEDAVRLAQSALEAPDRRAHNSRDPAQDRAIAGLLHRAALRLRAEQRMEDAIGRPLHERMGAWLAAQHDRFQAWLSGRVAARNLADEERLVGTFMIGTQRSAVMPPWLVGELTEVLGAGVVREAVRRARAEDRREGAAGYYDAFAAEAALSARDPERARELATRALATLQPAEALLRARMTAVVAEASRRMGDARQASEAYGEAFQSDPGVFRRFGWPVPVRMSVGAGGEELADLIEDSDRLDVGEWGMTVEVSAGRACLADPSGSMLACADDVTAEEGEDAEALTARTARVFFERAFAPRVDLSQTDANSLDGSNRVSRDPLRTMFGHEPPPSE